MINAFGTANSRAVSVFRMHLDMPDKDGRGSILQAYMAQSFHQGVTAWEKKHRSSAREMNGGTFARWMELWKDCFVVAIDTVLSDTNALKEEGTTIMDMEKLLQKLEPIEPLPGASMIALSNSGKRSAAYRIWVAQQKAQVAASMPARWQHFYEPHLASGGGLGIPLKYIVLGGGAMTMMGHPCVLDEEGNEKESHGEVDALLNAMALAPDEGEEA